MSVSERNSLLLNGATQIVHLLQTSGIIAQSLTVKWLSTRCNKSAVSYHTLWPTWNFIASAAAQLLSGLDSGDILYSFTLNMSISDDIPARRRTAEASTSSGKPSKPSAHVYQMATRYVLDRPRFESWYGERLYALVQFGTGADPVPCTMGGTGSVSRG